jgi:hypothetical protein
LVIQSIPSITSKPFAPKTISSTWKGTSWITLGIFLQES